MTCICIDAGMVIKLVSPEAGTELTEHLFEQWKADQVEMIAPPFAAAEVDSVLRQQLVRGNLSQEAAEQAFQVARRLPIRFDTETDCRERAWSIAQRFNLATVYDAVYLALAELRGCEFWTADQKLHERVKDQLPYVHLLGS